MNSQVSVRIYHENLPSCSDDSGIQEWNAYTQFDINTPELTSLKQVLGSMSGSLLILSMKTGLAVSWYD